jgi:hypothetical protein
MYSLAAGIRQVKQGSKLHLSGCRKNRSDRQRRRRRSHREQPLLATDLALRGVAFDRAELLAWVSSMWPWCEDDPNVRRWANGFVMARTAQSVEQPV